MAETTGSPLLDEPTNNEVLLEATDGTERPIVPLSDETNKILPDGPKDTEMSPVATDITDHAKELLQDETHKSLPETTNGLLPEATDHADPMVSTLPDETEEVTSDPNERDSILPEETGGHSNKKLDSDSLRDVTEMTLEPTTESPGNSETASAQIEQITETDGTTAKTVEMSKDGTGNSSPSQLSEHEAGLAKDQTLSADTTTKKVMGEISYSQQSNKPQQDTTLGDIPPDMSSMQPIETSSVVSELPEFSQTPDTTLTNSSSGSSPPQQSTTNDTGNKELSGSNSTGNSETSQTKHDPLKSCIIRLTEFSNKEQDRWMSSSSRSTTTSSEMEGISSSANDSRYNMCARPLPSEPSNSLTGRKRAVENYREHGYQDSGRDRDYEATPKPPQPLDNKSYPSASRMATQRLIETNKAKKQTKRPNNGSLLVATGPLQKSACIGNLNAENNTLPDATEKSGILPLPDKTPNSRPVGIDATTNQSNAVPSDTTNSKSVPPTKLIPKMIMQ